LTKAPHGKVRVKTIELIKKLGMAESQDVEITVRTVSSIKATRTGEGFLLTEGASADDPTGTPSWRKFIFQGLLNGIWVH
jgi:hypothetical protein